MYQFVQTKQHMWRKYPQLAQSTTEMMNSDFKDLSIHDKLIANLCMITHHTDHQQVTPIVTASFFESTLQTFNDSTCWYKVQDWQYFTEYKLSNYETFVLGPENKKYRNTKARLLQYSCDHEFSNQHKVMVYSQHMIADGGQKDKCQSVSWNNVNCGFAKQFYLTSSSLPNVEWCFKLTKFYCCPTADIMNNKINNHDPWKFGISCTSNTLTYVLTEDQKYKLVASLLLKIEDLFWIPLSRMYCDLGHKGMLPYFQQIDNR